MQSSFDRLPRFIQLGLILVAVGGRLAFAQSTLGDLAQRASMLKPMPGDRVLLQVYGDPTMNRAATIDERGRVVLPRIGMLQAAAFSFAALRDTVRARAASFLKDPDVDVYVQRRIIVSGEVIRPGVYYADLTSSLGEMVAQAGGLRETGHPGKVYLVRGTERTNIRDWQSDQSPATDLHSGDQIQVGRRSWLQLNLIPFATMTMSAVALVVSLATQLKGGN
jgi:protein involved in polysaccharide export with SLBB domain